MKVNSINTVYRLTITSYNFKSVVARYTHDFLFYFPTKEEIQKVYEEWDNNRVGIKLRAELELHKFHQIDYTK